jgi:site-specific DNA recombinase
MIRQDRLEDQLLAGLTERVLRPEMLEYTLQRFSEELQRRLRQIQEESAKAASGVSLLQERRRELKTKADNLAEAIAAMGHSPTLLSQLATVETQISRIDQDLAEINAPHDLEITMADLRKFVSEKALDLQAVLRADVTAARQALAKHIEKLVLTPKETPNGPVLEVSAMWICSAETSV